jgi:hypothetical protein
MQTVLNVSKAASAASPFLPWCDAFGESQLGAAPLFTKLAQFFTRIVGLSGRRIGFSFLKV